MLRFFRKYNKILLAVFGTGLMVIFLIEPAMRGCGAVPQAQNLGTLAGLPVTRADQQQAAVQLNVIAALAGQRGQEGLPLYIASQLYDPWAWMLTSKAARKIGLSVGSEEIEVALAALKLTEEDIANVSRGAGVSRAFVRGAVGEWILTDRYRGLVYGMTPISVADRVQRYNELASLIASGGGDITLLLGEPYLSHRIVENYIHAWRSTVKISMILMPYSKSSDLVPEPSEEQLQALFEKHKGHAAGQGPPHGFGYLVPDQIKLEYLALSLDDVEAKIEISDREAFDYFSNNRDLFTEKVLSSAVDVVESSSEGAASVALESLDGTLEEPPLETTRQLGFAEALQDVMQRARRHKAAQKADAIIRRARQLLNEPIESMPVRQQYRDLPGDFVPTPLQTVAEQILEEEGIGLQVHGAGGTWYGEEQLWNVPQLADASAALPGTDERSVPFALYALSVRELGAKSSPVTARLQLQQSVASMPVRSDEGRFLFRVTDVSPFSAPAFEDVRDAVLADARKLAAYERLVVDAALWVERVQTIGGLDAAGEKPDYTLLSPRPFAAREMTQFGFHPPAVDGVGRSPQFVDAVLQAAAKQWVQTHVASSEGEAGAGQTPPPELLAVPLPHRLSLAIVRINEYEPMPRSDYDAMAVQLFPYARAVLTDLSGINPLSAEALEKRLDYQEPPAAVN